NEPQRSRPGAENRSVSLQKIPSVRVYVACEPRQACEEAHIRFKKVAPAPVLGASLHCCWPNRDVGIVNSAVAERHTAPASGARPRTARSVSWLTLLSVRKVLRTSR